MRRLFLFAVVLTIMIGAGSAYAGELKVGPNYNLIWIDRDSNKNVQEGAGSIHLSYLDGVLLPYLYCVDIDRTIYVQGTYSATVNQEGKIHDNSLLNDSADEVAYLLAKYGSDAGNDPTKSAALQAAIWHVMYRYNLGDDSRNDPLRDYYNTYITDVGQGDVSQFTWISPASGDTKYQGLVTRVPEPTLILLLGIGLAAVSMAASRIKN